MWKIRIGRRRSGWIWQRDTAGEKGEIIRIYSIGSESPLAPEEEKLKIREARKLGSTRRQREEAVAYRGQVREMVKQGTDFADQRNAQLQNASQRRAPRGEKKTVQQKPPVRSK